MIPEADPLHKVTIVPRGQALGLTQQIPLDDRHTYSKDYLEAQISVLMAGSAAEMMFLNKMTTGRPTTSRRPPRSPARWSASGACRSSGR